jgi:hypothetical protein
VTRPSDSGRRQSPTSDRDLPQDEFPDERLVHVVEGRADGTERCILYPADAPSHVVETQWLAVDGDLPIDAVDKR